MVDVQRDPDELSFLDNVFQNLKSAGVKVPVLAHLTEWVGVARRTVGGKFGAGGLNIEIPAVDGGEVTTLEHQIERLFHDIEASGERVLIAVAELPVLLEALERADPSRERLRNFLNWFRALRLRYRKNIRWLLLGSVGLDTFAELRRLTPAINDLQPASLGAYPDPVAIAFLQTLATSKGFTLPPELCAIVLAEVGSPLPFFLQLVFHELYSQLGRPPRQPTAADMSSACARLLAPQFYKHFEPWRGRLSEGMDADHHRTALTILNTLCVNSSGLSRATLLTSVVAKFPQRDTDEIARILATALGQLERDGYLLRQPAPRSTDAVYAFRSFLLRRYWHAREIA